MSGGKAVIVYKPYATSGPVDEAPDPPNHTTPSVILDTSVWAYISNRPGLVDLRKGITCERT